MKAAMRILALLVVIFLPTSAMAQTNTCKPNGCGPSGLLGLLVPDSTPISGCTFVSACNSHDLCYSRCESCGDLAGKPLCKNAATRNERKRQCDAAFLNEIKTANIGNLICDYYASTYAFMVGKLGRTFFNGKERPEERLALESDAKAFREFGALAILNPSAETLSEITKGIRELGKVATISTSVTFDNKNGIPRLSLQSTDLNKQSITNFSSTTEKIRRERTINDIDVSNLVVNSRPFDLNAATGINGKINLKNLIQRDSFFNISPSQ